jgi:hypothetical protein
MWIVEPVSDNRDICARELAPIYSSISRICIICSPAAPHPAMNKILVFLLFSAAVVSAKQVRPKYFIYFHETLLSVGV